jgi:hypothetical protein
MARQSAEYLNLAAETVSQSWVQFGSKPAFDLQGRDIECLLWVQAVSKRFA